MKSSHPVADYMHPFFYQYLAGVKGVSDSTIISYRDAIKLLLCFGANQLKKTGGSSEHRRPGRKNGPCLPEPC
ncbi:MAG: hypothetical protein DRH43_05870 [Deltaproteobacteria bacterium]|nr:MAG: hypothetical protein DRH43_05870 [Deltaproteobacteria bacterium]